jgi:DNA polymerase elongation subunit (family B)
MRFYTSVCRIGNNICVREQTDTGPNKYKVKYEPTLYTTSNAESGLKTLYGDTVKPVKPGTMSACRDYIKQYKDVGGFHVFGQTDYVLAYINEFYPEEIHFDIKRISAWVLDIETFLPEDENGRITGFPHPEDADAPINLIALQDLHTRQVYSFGYREFTGKADTKYMNCGTEKEMLKQVILFWNQKSVEICTGWNVDGFDILFLYNRIVKVLGVEWANKLSPWETVEVKKSTFRGKDQYKVIIYGVTVLDYMELYKKFSMVKQESYSLSHISLEELGEDKLDHSEYKNFNDFARRGWNEKFVPYNARDCQLVGKLDDKLKLLELALTISFLAKINFDNVFGPVRTWDAIIHNALLKENKVIPLKDQDGDSHHESIEGAYVKDPKVGFIRWPISIDAESLYPSNAIMLNMSPETYLGMVECSLEMMLKGISPTPGEMECLSPIGAKFRKDFQGIIPRLFEGLKITRKSVKKDMLQLKQQYEIDKDKALPSKISALDNKQQALKILLNSAYGALGNKGFRFYNPNIAESITSLGQYALKIIEAELDAILCKRFKMPEGTKFVVYCDTDSVFFEMGPVVDKYFAGKEKAVIVKALEKIAVDIIQHEVDHLMEKVSKMTNAYKKTLYFKLENVGDIALWVSKKKYIVRVHSSEGVTYAKPKYKVMGLDIVKSSTPAWVRTKLKGSLDLIFDTDESTVQKFLADSRADFIKLPVDQIAFPRGANNIDSFANPVTIYNSRSEGTTPMHVRAALLYNYHVKKLGLDGTYPLIPSGSKIRFVYLKMPNAINENIIGFPADEHLPEELGLDQYIDRDLQFDKTMVASMQNILDAIGWNAVEVSSLDAFFG